MYFITEREMILGWSVNITKIQETSMVLMCWCMICLKLNKLSLTHRLTSWYANIKKCYTAFIFSTKPLK